MKCFKIAGIMVTLLTFTIVNVYRVQSKGKVSEAMMVNIEALASDEPAPCSNYCKEWSGTSGGGIACDCARYSGRCKNYC